MVFSAFTSPTDSTTWPGHAGTCGGDGMIYPHQSSISRQELTVAFNLRSTLFWSMCQQNQRRPWSHWDVRDNEGEDRNGDGDGVE